VDDDTLVMADRSGVEIDYCPKCRGVWLDRGELDKIIERAAGGPAPQVRPAPPPPQFQPTPQYQAPQDRRHGRRDDDDDDDDDYRGSHRKKRRESLLGELFDF
jgi:uncharacterized protein